MGELTAILQQCADGNPLAPNHLIERVEAELRVLAHRTLAGEPSDIFFQTTMLVNETWLRLVNDCGRLSFQNRAHFYSAAATAMRRIAIDGARHRLRLKRSGPVQHVVLDEIPVAIPDETLLQLEAALPELTSIIGPLATSVVEHIFFAGYSKKDTAEILGITEHRLNTIWELARAKLRKLLTKEL
ncbi:MAG: RNA polymerase subunit sigma [Planctomycetota bacterium]|nr:MAG: RNA polymerase subunit sigma [Planctomycetota bacterium]